MSEKLSPLLNPAHNKIKRIKGLNYFLTILSASLLYISFTFSYLSFFIWFSYVPILIVVFAEKKYSRILIFLTLTSFLFYFFYLFWMRNYKHPAALPGGILTTTIFFLMAGFGARVILDIIRRARFQRVFWPSVIGISSWWLFVDYLKSRGFLAFPWGIPGYSQYDILFMIQSASIFGVWGIDFLIILTNVMVTHAVFSFIIQKNISREVIFGLCTVVVLVSVNAFYGFIVLKNSGSEIGLASPSVRSLRVCLLQPNFDPWNPDVVKNLSLEFRLTEEALREDPELVVWSESSVPFLYDFYLRKRNRYAMMVDRFFKKIGKPVIFGTLEFEGEVVDDNYFGNFYNVVIFYEAGIPRGKYRKIHLVPFGEWFPYDKLFPFVDKSMRKAGVEEFTPGFEYTVFDLDGIYVSPLICFEDVFGDLTRRFVLRGSQVLVNVTNDAWTGSAEAEWQHFRISIFRAIENRRSLVRSANGGITAGIDPWGRVLKVLEPFLTDYLIVDVPVMEREIITFYTKHGDFLPKIAVLGVVFLLIFAIFKKIVDLRIG